MTDVEFAEIQQEVDFVVFDTFAIGVLGKDDIRQEAWLAAVRAYKLFDPTKKVPLRIYIRQRLRHHVQDLKRRQDLYSRPERKELKAAGAAGVRKNISTDLIPMWAVRVCDPAYELAEKKLTFERLLAKAILSPVERAVLLHYAAGGEYKELVSPLKVSQGRVSQIVLRALERIRYQWSRNFQLEMRWCQGCGERYWFMDRPWDLERSCSPRCNVTLARAKRAVA